MKPTTPPEAPPNDGVATDAMLDLMLKVAENINDVPIPYMRLKSNKSRLQLTKKDVGPGGHFIDALGRKWASLSRRPRTLTVSGAKPRLEVSGNKFVDAMINHKIQSLMAGATNDGLVAELSVDMNVTVFSREAPEYVHLNTYPEYREINHSHLVDNEYLARFIYNWLTEGTGIGVKPVPVPKTHLDARA